jgi:hypothetical protein
VWPKLQKQVAVEMEQIKQLLETHRPLLQKCARVNPDAIERSALAAMLHSFYTGIENIFKRVAVEIDGEPLRGEIWHRQLLDRMAHPGKNRPATISEALKDKLHLYLEFRHVFRHAYTFELRWEKMASFYGSKKMPPEKVKTADCPSPRERGLKPGIPRLSLYP